MVTYTVQRATTEFLQELQNVVPVTVKVANNGKCLLVFDSFQIIQINDNESKIIFKGEWEALCNSQLITTGIIPHPYWDRIPCKVNGVQLSKYFLEQFYKAFGLDGPPKFEIYSSNSIKRQVEQCNHDHLMICARIELDKLQDSVLQLVEEDPKEDSEGWDKVRKHALSLSGRELRAQLLISFIVAKHFKL